MLTFLKEYTDCFPYPMDSFGIHPGYLFFDIETTGLSAQSSVLYLIGCLYTDGHDFRLYQWFSENPNHEKEVLLCFSAFLEDQSEDTLLIQFNGNGFDIPYLRKRYEHYRQPFPLDRFETLDLYRVIKPYKKLLGLPSLRQKAVEDYLSISRNDPFDGGQLISVYQDYVHTQSAEDLNALLLHNLEDVQNMPRLLAVLQVRDYLNGPFKAISHRIHSTTTLDGQPKEELLVSLQSSAKLTSAITVRMDDGIYLIARGDQVRLSLRMSEATLKYYFPEPRDYFYLPGEDRAVHKSVGIYVEPEFRQKATKDTCYVKKTGTFIPCLPGTEIPVGWHAFHSDRKEKGCSLEWSEMLFSDSPDTDRFWDSYVKTILTV